MRSVSSRLTPICLLLCLSAIGCTSFKEYVSNRFKVGSDYKRPDVPIADEWIDSNNPKVSSEEANLRSWWLVFEDPVLNNLVQTAYQQNITLREVGFRVAEARAQRGVVAGNLFPQTQDVIGDFTHTQRSTQTALFPQVDPNSPFANLAARQYGNWRVGGSLAWELDFWGRYRRAIEAADARLDSSIEEYDDALVLLIGEVASTYIELRTVDQRLEVARQNGTLQAESVRVAQARFDAMAVNSELDTPQAKSNLGNTLAAIEALEIQRRRSQNRLAVLMGMPPHDLSYLLEGSRDIPVPPDVVSAGVPADLIWNRPDVRRAERLVAAQSEEIGIAQAELYPHISINGLLSWDAAHFSDIFKGGAFGGTIGPSFRWNILNYGRLLNNIRVQDARFQQLIANYQQTVLTANEEAENAIVSYLHFSEQVQVLDESARQALEAERVAQVKYREGEIDFNRLYSVQQLLLSQQEALAAARGNAALSLVDLYRALGGGWEIRLDPVATTMPIQDEILLPTPVPESVLLPAPIAPAIPETP
ncbi:transporter [Bremerella cremea]|uniref:Transporter n=1 Tax=Bremerella cremea TaxID=1031537 RepID=A0A368KSH1_9BACT|nr:efflux transporter outer membrane subunit [Bremerella cremea]RCS51920.1 transporter [Bremerella cremea]